MKMFESHREGGAKLQSKMAFGAEGVSRAMVTLLTPAVEVLVYATLERLSLYDSSLSAVLWLSSSRLSSSPLSSSRCPLRNVLLGVFIVLAMQTNIYYKYSRILPMPSNSLAHLSPDSHTPQAHQTALNRLPHALTTTAY